MGLLTGQLNSIISNDTKSFGYDIDQVMLKSDLPTLDYLNGSVEFDNAGNEIFNVGFDAGKAIMFVGKPGSGKSSLAVQWLSSSMMKYEESTMYIMDFEGSHTPQRIKALTGMSDAYFNNHVFIKKAGIYTESVLKLVKQISMFKKEHEADLLVENKEGILNDDGSVKKILPPTFVIVDSLASMKSADYQEGDELNSLTVHGRQAIINKDMMNRCLQPMLEGNIILAFIGQVTTNMSMGVTPPESQTRFLKNTEAIAGGAAMLYLSNLILKVEAKDKLEPKDKYGIKGFISNITVVKSRNAAAGNSVSFVFNQNEGFDRDLSMFEYLKANQLIKGAGVGMYLDGYEQYKFRMSNLKEKLNTIPEFRQAFEDVTLAALRQSLAVSSKAEKSAIENAAPEVTEETVEEINEPVSE